jgi:hypothetical protein
MPSQPTHDATPPQHWPTDVIYLTKARLSPTFPHQLVPLLHNVDKPKGKFSPQAITHPTQVQIKPVNAPSHPANGQLGLFAKQKIPPTTLIIPYLGVVHHTLIPADSTQSTPDTLEEEEESDYDLSMLRVSASELRNPFPGYHISIGVDAARQGNAGRFVNDYRGIANGPNAEFRVGAGEAGELRMEIWSLKNGIAKGDEVLVSYGKSWWAGRTGS